jgi:agmatinase
MKWMNLPEQYSKGKFVILPIAYEKDVTSGKGASRGPQEIIKASKHLEYYDEQFDCEPFEEGIELLETIEASEPEEMINLVSNKVKELKDKFIIGLGGDHAVTIGLVKGQEKLHEEFSVIQFDAHPDMFHSWNGSQYNHRCTAQRISINHDLALIGVRSMDVDEKNIIENNEDVHLIKIYDFDANNLRQILSKLKQKVYLSIDVDVFDPSFIRNTGTPEPGGIGWYNLIAALKIIFKEKEVIGADVVEFAPKENFAAEAYALAKLVYKIMALKKV